jgi:hypothetical protein
VSGDTFPTETHARHALVRRIDRGHSPEDAARALRTGKDPLGHFDVSDEQAREWSRDEQEIRARLRRQFDDDPEGLVREWTFRRVDEARQVFEEADASRHAGRAPSPLEQRALVKLQRETSAMLLEESQRRGDLQKPPEMPGDSELRDLVEAHEATTPAAA